MRIRTFAVIWLVLLILCILSAACTKQPESDCARYESELITGKPLCTSQATTTKGKP